MKSRWIATSRKTVVLVSLLGFSGLLIPAEAYSMPTPTGSGSEGAVSPGGGGIRHEGRRGRVARGKSKHPKKLKGGGQARTKGKARPMARGRGRQEKVACVEAFDKAKETVRDSRFRAAKEWFARCARPSCGRPLRQRCATLHTEVIAALPSVVPVVTDVSGIEGRDIEVKMDGEILTSNVDGSAINVDPGDHEFSFSKDGQVFATKKLVVEKGERNQVLSVAFPSRRHQAVDLSPTPIPEEPTPAAAPARVQVADTTEESASSEDEPASRTVRRVSPHRASVETDPKSGAPWSAYALAGVGVLGIGGYGAFTLKGRANNDYLAATCSPNCGDTNVKHIRNLYLAADISLGIGIAALAASTYFFLRDNGGEEEESARSRSHISGLGVEPMPSGAVATVGGTF